MTRLSLTFPVGGVRTAIAEAAHRARTTGAMQPIVTEQRIVWDGGVRFLVRKVSSLIRKEGERRERDRSSQAANPFLPYEAELFVTDVSDTHLALLNKFNVIDDHLLIVTRHFAHQETVLDQSDFFALIACMREFDGLGFYNGGKVGGASQMHKHLQLVPLPLAPEGLSVPIEGLLAPSGQRARVRHIPELPFRHAFCEVDVAPERNLEAAARELAALYRNMLACAGIAPITSGDETRQSGPYNLLVTNRWMLLVARRSECCHGISINALGFAGSLFVRDDEQMRKLQHLGPMAVLRAVAMP